MKWNGRPLLSENIVLVERSILSLAMELMAARGDLACGDYVSNGAGYLFSTQF